MMRDCLEVQRTLKKLNAMFDDVNVDQREARRLVTRMTADMRAHVKWLTPFTQQPLELVGAEL